MKKFIFPTLALIFATVTSVGAYQFLQNRESVSVASPAAIPTVSVVVAKNDIEMGKDLTASDLVVQKWPENIVTEHHFTHPNLLIGRKLKANLIKDEPILKSKLLKEGENISNLIPPNRRGVSITVRSSETLKNVLEKGSVVDVISINNNDKPYVAANGAVVMAIDGGIKATTKSGGSTMELLLLVKSRDAAAISQAKSYGNVEVVLSNHKTTIMEIS